MPTISKSLLQKSRTQSRKASGDLSKATQKSGKERVREAFYSFEQGKTNRRGAQLQQASAQFQKGGITNIVV